MKNDIKKTTWRNSKTGEILLEQVVCADCGKVINKKDADYSLGKDRPLCQSCFEFRESGNFWW